MAELRILLLLPDLADVPSKGYQVRAMAFAEYLRGRHRIAVISAVESRLADSHLAARARPLHRARVAAMMWWRGWPLQAALFDGGDVAQRLITRTGRSRFDVAAVFTERLPISTLALAERIPTVLDAVDAMDRNMLERARAAGPLDRWLWVREARAFSRLSKVLSGSVHRVVVSAERERATYPEAVVIPNAASEVSAGNRDEPRFDIAFTGSLYYWPNILGVVELCDRIVPRIRTALPGVRVVVAGRQPTGQVRAACRDAGVTLLSDVKSIADVLRASRVAVAPLQSATGLQIKVIEALAVGTPVLAYPAVTAGLSAGLTGVVECADAQSLAEAAIGVLRGTLRVMPDVSAELSWGTQAIRFERLLQTAAGDETAALQLDSALVPGD